MWPFISPISLIRYLVVWRVNASLVWVPRYLAAEISQVLGTLIANRLPTQEAYRWRKTLAAWDEANKDKEKPEIPEVFPDTLWPIESVVFVYPGKPSYGPGERILWEFKLLGASADHGRFLEVILPAMEEASTTADPRWQRQNGLWGKFDIDSIYVARGNRWEPFVRTGQLDLRYRATPEQWAEGLMFAPPAGRIFDRLTWLTPFDLSAPPPPAPLVEESKPRRPRRADRRLKRIPTKQAPTLPRILEALAARLCVFLPGKYHTTADVWNSLSAEEQAALQAALEQAAIIPLHHQGFSPAPKHGPGRWIGTQTFPSIPSPIIPYLELASILHLGQQTHFGCGTFSIA
jgi:hypothetical protein